MVFAQCRAPPIGKEPVSQRESLSSSDGSDINGRESGPCKLGGRRTAGTLARDDRIYPSMDARTGSLLRQNPRFRSEHFLPASVHQRPIRDLQSEVQKDPVVAEF